MKKISIVGFYGMLFAATLFLAYGTSRSAIQSFFERKEARIQQPVLAKETEKPISVKGSTSAATTADVVAKANALLALTTNSSQLALLQQTYTTSLARKWSNLPCGSGCRNGLEFVNMTAAQLTAAKAVIAAAAGTTTNEGYDEFMQIVTADSILNISATANNASAYSSGYYFICFLNAPTTTGAWMLQWGGHHYAANVAFNGGVVVGVTPRFEGVEPKVFSAYPYSGRIANETVTYAPISQERNAMAYMLSTLSTAQLATAKNSSTFSDVTLAPGETNGGSGTFPTTKVGLAVSTLVDSQKTAVINAIKPWIQDVDDASYATLLAQYTNEINSVYISWTGSGTSRDSSSFLISNTNYVRLDGTNVWIEFVCQSGVVFSSQIHYHSVWRDHTKDYGIDLTSTSLPLRLLDFTATNQNNGRLVSWTTSDEVNVDHFEVERSIDDGTGGFSPVTSIAAKNNGLTDSYSYLDAALLTGNIFYYRLKMVDKDGSVSYGKTVALKNNLSITTGISLYPNPATTQLKVSTVQALGNATFRVINAEGKTVLVRNGVTGTLNNIDISKLATGMYQLRIIDNGSITSTKFLKTGQ